MPQSPPSQSVPSGKVFNTPLLLEMLEATGGDTSKLVPAQRIVEGVVRRMGYDKNNLPHGWGLWTSNNTGIGDRIGWSFSNNRRDRGWFITERMRDAQNKMVRCWGITEKGAQAAALLAPQRRPERREKNATALWFDKHLTPPSGHTKAPLMGQMETALKRHLPISSRAGLIEDHINTYVMRAIHRDAFARHLQEGEIPYSKVVSYCVNSGRTDARNMGTDGLCRELYGARTERERAGRVRIVDESDQRHCWDTDGSIIPPDETFEVNFGMEDAFEKVWRRVEAVIRSRKPRAWERYSDILALRAQEMSLAEIARAKGMSRNRAATMLADVRKVLREGVEAGKLDAGLDL